MNLIANYSNAMWILLIAAGSVLELVDGQDPESILTGMLNEDGDELYEELAKLCHIGLKVEELPKPWHIAEDDQTLEVDHVGYGQMEMEKFGRASWVTPEGEDCRTPYNVVGDCISVRECQPMVDYLRTAPKPLPRETVRQIQRYNCGFEGTTIKVCCPPAGQPIIPSATSDSPPPPPDVTRHRNFNLLPNECGISDIQDKIRGGKNALLNEFPWMALLSYNTRRRGPQFKCGGSIINERYILTAAHCISDLTEPLLGVRIGEHNIDTRPDCETDDNDVTKCAPPVQDLAIQEIIIHPAYNASTISNDIGLLRVTRMNLNVDNAKPICLPVDESTRNAKFNFTTVTGWGYLDNRGTPGLILQKVDLPFTSLQDCQKAYQADRRARITYKQLCAGGKDAKDSCPGDSGGPLQVNSYVQALDSPAYVQQGVVSFGPRECGLAGFPGVYTRVAYYMDWILDNMKP